MALMLKRRHGQAVIIETPCGCIRIEVRDATVHLAIEAPAELSILREELKPLIVPCDDAPAAGR